MRTESLKERFPKVKTRLSMAISILVAWSEGVRPPSRVDDTTGMWSQFRDL